MLRTVRRTLAWLTESRAWADAIVGPPEPTVSMDAMTAALDRALAAEEKVRRARECLERYGSGGAEFALRILREVDGG